MRDDSADKVRVVLRHLKGEVQHEVVDTVFGRLAPTPSGSEFANLATPLGHMRLCPVEVFRLLRDRALTVGEPYVAQCKLGTQLGWHIEVLFRRASEERTVPGRSRGLYMMHSTRVASICYLPQAGLTETIISVSTLWTSDHVLCYGWRQALDPTSVGLWPFYNPEALAGAYSGGG